MQNRGPLIDFYRDWVEYLRQELLSAGYKVDPKADSEEIEMMSFNLGKRRIRSHARQLLFAKEFTCPNEHKEALEQIKEAVKTGAALTPYQSRAVTEKPTAKDGLLFDWDIHHLHLGEEMEDSGFVCRTKELLFVRITDTTVYFLTVGTHGGWGEIELLEIIHRNWPETIAHRKLSGIVMGKGGVPPTADEIVGARKAGLFTMVPLSDGTVYSSPGGGIATSGDSVAAVDGMFQHRRWVRDLQSAAERRMGEFLAKARKKGWKPGKPIQVRLGFLNGVPYAILPDYGLKFRLTKR